MTIREIWSRNLKEEMKLIKESIKSCDFVAVDTEFPGCLRETAMEASDETRYDNLKFNVDRTIPIQLGFSLLDSHGRISGTWEVNFSDFDETKDACNEKSIAFLKRNGLDFNRIRREGIGVNSFFSEFTQMINECGKKMTWVTFDGSYDLGYVIKGVTGGDSLPETSQDFQETVQRLLGSTVDVKKLANTRLGLQRLAYELRVRRVGEAHHAGSDSQLTACVFTNVKLTLSRDLKRKRQEHLILSPDAVTQEIEHEQRQHEYFMMMQQEVVMERELFMRRCMPRRCYGPPVQPPRLVMYARYPAQGGYFVVPFTPRLSNHV